AAVAEWVKAQNVVTFSYLEKIPFRQKIRERLTAIWNYPRYGSPFREGKYYYYYKNDGLQNQSVLYKQASPDSKGEVFIDPNTFSTDGTVALGSLSFSRDGSRLAFGISKSGSDWVDIVLMDVATKTTSDTLRWVKFSGVSWYGDGFFYSRYDAPADTSKMLSKKNEYHKVYYHRAGTRQAQDALVYEDPSQSEFLFGVSVTEDESIALLSASRGSSRGNALSYKNLTTPAAAFTPIITTTDDRIYAVENVGEKLILFTNRNAPNGKLLLFDPAHPAEADWKTIIPEKEEVLSGVSSAGGKLFLTYIKDVSHRVYVYDFNGALEREIALPVPGTAGGFSGKNDERELFFSVTSFTSPSTIYRYDVAAGTYSLYRKTDIDFNPDEYVTKQVFYNSKDGTRIPMFVIHKRGITLDGTNPTLLYGYGGFNASMMPSFSVTRLAFIEQGGVYALANLRGGGEYGEKWHEAGMKLNKQNVFDDFISAAEYLIAQKYTSPAKLAIQGGSNGGLLVGAVANQRPELFRVALPAVGVMDMLRFHRFTIGWAWVADYGSSDDSVQFKNLLSYSPLHNIGAGAPYPAMLVTTADHDDRVVPAHSFKYISTLQDAYHGPNPVLIRIETKAGHGGGKPISKVIEENADLYAFMLYNLGVTPKYP
ncbi:MAG TPA: prolyl oligopeptidase family serine peptidase, partial [Bacteroidota bacterium]|nr:prolyl oligopeptidase family serine peptidase [Bacteroidota bacterium]